MFLYHALLLFLAKVKQFQAALNFIQQLIFKYWTWIETERLLLVHGRAQGEAMQAVASPFLKIWTYNFFDNCFV